ncbi:MAG: SRPBCC domain-containing protein [Ilumatobacteraceae bacterium]
MNRPIEEAWPIICDIERIAPCLPGAQLEEIEGDVYRGRVKVKLGAVTTQFKGEAKFLERDDEAHTAKLNGKGRDTGGRGNAEADIYAVAEALSPTSTKCTVTADLKITGKVAQFGRGIMGDVSKKLMDQFASNLNTMLDDQNGDAPASPAADVQPATDAASNGQAQAPTRESTAKPPTAESTTEPQAAESTANPPAPESSVRKINGPAAEPIDMADMAGAALLKRLAPVAALVMVLFLVLRRRR